MFPAKAFNLVAFTLGAGLHVFLAVLLARKRAAGRADRVALAAVAAAGLWHVANAIALFHAGVAGSQSELLLDALRQASTLGLAFVPPLLVHLALVWGAIQPATGFSPALAYLTVPLAWAPAAQRPLLLASLLVSAAWCLRGAARQTDPIQTHFLRAFAVTLALAAAGSLQPGTAAVAALAPPLCFAWFVYRYNLHGLLISRRLVFALTLGVVFAFYLVLVRILASFLEDAFLALGPLVEVALLFAAALVWLPLYGWMSRFLSQRTQLYADFSKRLIEDAARILDLGRRLRFVAEELGRSFEVRRALLRTTEGGIEGRFGPAPAPSAAQLERLESLARAHRVELVHVDRTQDPQMRELLAELGFTYLFPLWYEDRLTGLLLLDTAPRRFLDENESILLGLSRQISHSIETCRLIEREIELDRALARQEHLASLGKVAATIAHEIKNPLSSIKTLAQLMREDPQVEQGYARDLGFIVGETDRLNRSVLQLLNFSRPALELESEVNVSELLETTAGVLAREHAGGQVRVEHSIEPGLKLQRANPELIKQVALNLALNAIQASPPGSTVRLDAAARPGGGIVIAVSDQGPGIPAQLREKIFEPFYTTKQKGAGLGLAIVRKNVRHMNGELRVESPIDGNGGTRMVVTLGTA